MGKTEVTEGSEFSDEDINKIKDFARHYPDYHRSQDDNPSLKHYIKMHKELITWAHEESPSLTVEQFFAQKAQPIKMPKRKARKR